MFDPQLALVVIGIVGLVWLGAMGVRLTRGEPFWGPNARAVGLQFAFVIVWSAIVAGPLAFLWNWI